MKVPRLPKRSIAGSVAAVFDDYEATTGRPAAPPVDVEDMVERYFELDLGYVDFDEKYGMKGVLGATFVKRRMICVNEKLIGSRLEGRLAFTIAHEIGHWCLHRHLVNQAERSAEKKDAILCRTKDAKLPIEWQADYFAACLLMPEDTMKHVFHWIFGSRPLEILNVKSSYAGPLCFDPCVKNWPLIAARVRDAGGFLNVSKQAIIIRLQDLGLIKNRTNVSMGWTTAAPAV